MASPLALSPPAGVALGTVLGLAYWATRADETQRAWVSSEANGDADCGYLAAPVTDLAAFAGGMYCAVRGVQADEPLVAAFGSAVVVIHALQFFRHRR